MRSPRPRALRTTACPSAHGERRVHPSTGVIPSPVERASAVRDDVLIRSKHAELPIPRPKPHKDPVTTANSCGRHGVSLTIDCSSVNARPWPRHDLSVGSCGFDRSPTARPCQQLKWRQSLDRCRCEPHNIDCESKFLEMESRPPKRAAPWAHQPTSAVQRVSGGSRGYRRPRCRQ